MTLFYVTYILKTTICSHKYSKHLAVFIGKMDSLCLHCHALKFKKEAPGMCCSNGKELLPRLNEPPEPLKLYMSGNTDLSKHFLSNIRKYNSAFQMTSFAASKIVNDGFMPTYKIQGQVYHLIGSLLPFSDNEYKYVQIYFMGDKDKEIDQRYAISKGMNREIISNIQQIQR